MEKSVITPKLGSCQQIVSTAAVTKGESQQEVARQVEDKTDNLFLVLSEGKTLSLAYFKWLTSLIYGILLTILETLSLHSIHSKRSFTNGNAFLIFLTPIHCM